MKTVLSLFLLAASAFAQTVVSTYTSYVPAEVNAKAYGIVGNGTTDDSSALTSALSANNAVSLPYSSSGYKIASGITLSDRQQLNCNGSALLVATNNQIGLTLAGSHNVVTNCYISTSGSPTGTTGILIKPSGSSSSYNRLSKIRIDGVATGIRLDSTVAGNYYNSFSDINIRTVTTGVEITADATAHSPNRHQFHKLIISNATTGVDIIYGDTNSFFGLAVEGVTTGVRIRNNTVNNYNSVFGYWTETVAGYAIQVDGTNANGNVFHNALVAANSISDSGSNTVIYSVNGSKFVGPITLSAADGHLILNPSGNSSRWAALVSDAGSSANYNGTYFSNNEKADGTQGNAALPTWRWDLGGYDRFTYADSQDAFTLWRKPAGGAYARAFRVGNSGEIRPGSVIFSALPASPGDGDFIYCSDCTKTTPCAGSGSGALAKRVNGAWDCN